MPKTIKKYTERDCPKNKFSVLNCTQPLALVSLRS